MLGVDGDDDSGSDDADGAGAGAPLDLDDAQKVHLQLCARRFFSGRQFRLRLPFENIV